MKSVKKNALVPPRKGASSGLSLAVREDRMHQDISAAAAAMEHATQLPDFKVISDYAAAQELFAARQGMSETVIRHAHTLRFQALARLGEALARTPKATGAKGIGKKPQRSAGPGRTHTPTLSELGIDKRTANLARTLSSMAALDLNAILADDKTVAQVQRESTARKRTSRITLPDAKYRVLYADPPWKYRDTADSADGRGAVQGKGAEHHYPTMSIDELCALDVKSLGDRDSVLWMWVTSPLLFECAPIIDAWGYTYRTSVVWDKATHNMGHYVSVQHEFLLICTRGSATPDTTKRQRSIIEAKPGRHSEKPEVFRVLIDTMYMKGKRIELFARKTPPALWDSWGNE